jgi:hypothetical protein
LTPKANIMNKSNLTNWLAALCAVLLVVLLVLQSKQNTQLDSLRQEHQAFVSATTQRQQEAHGARAKLADQLTQQQQEAHDARAKLADQLTSFGTNLESRLAQNEQQAKETMGEMANAVQQQTAVLHRALGKVIPVELPDSLTKKLSALEARISDEKSWPKDPTEAEARLAELRDLVRQIPPWAEEDLLPRLNAVRWGTSALALVAKAQAVTNDALGDFLDDVDTAIEAKPDGASELVLKRLTDIQSKCKVEFDAFRRDAAIADAKRLLKDGATPAEFSEVLGRLSEWSGVPDSKERVQNLQHDVRARVLHDNTTNFIASVDAGLLRARSETNAVARQISFGKLVDSVVSERQVLLDNPDADESLSRTLTEQAARIEKAIETDGKTQVAEQERKLRGYQAWALSQVRQYNADMDVDEKGDKGTIYDSPDYPAIENDMVIYLIPVSVGLLDPAMSRLYNAAFERGWKLLDGKNQKNLQTEVAEQEAVVQKKKP